MIILLLFALSFHLTTITATGTCNENDITHFLQKDIDNILINFASNHLLKFNRTIQCSSSSNFSIVNGCSYTCTELGYGQRDKISIVMYHDNGTIEEDCFIDYTTPLQPPSVANITIVDNKVRLEINRPNGSFDYVEVHCSDNQTHIIFNNSIPSTALTASVDCSFVLNLPLMSFILKTMKEDFDPPGLYSISPEVPLPIFFTHSINAGLLTVDASAPPTMNTVSNYQFQLLFHDQNDESITYVRDTVSNLNPKLGATFNYGLIPNMKHTIVFKHFVQSMGYSESKEEIPPVAIDPYPFAVTNLQIKEEFNSIVLKWTDNHGQYDPIEYYVFCNSSDLNSKLNASRYTKFVCEQITFDDTDTIAVQTQVAIPGYTYGQTAIAQIDVTQVPKIPILEVFDTTQNSITIRWNWNNQSLITNSFRYKINCSLDTPITDIDIQSNEHQCRSLTPSTLYVITIYLENNDATIQRSRSINANTLLEKCQFRNHFYSTNPDGTHTLIIEWSPPESNFDEIQVHCPSSSYTTFQSVQTMPIMFVKCIVTNGIPFNVTFATVKSGYEWAILQFTDTRTITSTTTTTSTSTTTTSTSTTSTTTSTSTTSTSTTTTTSTSTISTSTTTSAPTTSTSTTTPGVSTTTTTTPTPGVPTTTTTSGAPTTTTSGVSTTTTTLRVPTTVTITSRVSTATTTPQVSTATTSPGVSTATTTPYKQPSNTCCSQEELSDTQALLTRWRTVAIVTLIVMGFVLLALICLTTFFLLFFVRSRRNRTDK